jgi:hypothetical protein
MNFIKTASLRTASLFTASLFTASLFTASLFTASLLTASLLALPALAFQEKEATWETIFRDPYLNMMDMSGMTTGYFWNMGFPEIETVKKFDLQLSPSGQVYKNPIQTTPQDWKVLYNGIRASDINDRRQLLPLDEIRELEYEYMKSHNIIPVAILNFEGNILSENQIKENVSLKQSGKTNRELYKVLPVTVVSALRTSASQDVTFYLGDNLYFTNRRERVEGLLIDFGDGQGEKFYNLLPNYIPVHYAYGGRKSISFKLIAGRDTVQSFSTIQVPGPAIPADQEINLQPGTINTGIAGRNPKGGRAHIWLGCDGVFDKPFIMVEGFDEKNSYDPESFMRENQYGDVDTTKYESPGKILQTYGYDLVFLNFTDGTDDIKNNAEVTKQLIREVNTIKQGHFENIVIGHSMGGLVARVALAEMEQAGEDHETGLYISFDAPHRGASLPVGLQGIFLQSYDVINDINVGLDFSAIFNPLLLLFDVNSSEDFDENLAALQSEASRQMVIDYYDSNNKTQEEFQTFLQEVGYPEQLRKIALLNGSNVAAPQNPSWEPAEKFMDFSFTLLVPGPLGIPVNANFRAKAWAGNPNQLARVSQFKVSLGGVTIKNSEFKYAYDDLFMEGAPGGFRGKDKMHERVEEKIKDVKKTLDKLDAFDYEVRDPLYFNNVPAVSAIDLQMELDDNDDLYYFNNNLNSHKREDLILSQMTPFDEIYALDTNSVHVSKVEVVKDSWIEILEKEIMLEDLRLQNRTISTQIDFESQNQIITGINTQEPDWDKLIDPGDFVVKKDVVVTLTAANSIIFEEGTIIEEGGTLIANITGATDVVSCSGNGPVPPLTYGYVTLEGPDPYCSGQLHRTYRAGYETGSLNKTFSTRWALDNANLAESGTGNVFILPVELSPGGHTIRCELSVIDHTGIPIEQSVVSEVFMVLPPNDETCLQSQQMFTADVTSQINLNPNPAVGSTTLEIINQSDGAVSLLLLTLEGLTIKEIYWNEFLEKGVYQYHLNTSDLKTGIYLVSLETARGKETKRLEVIN